MAFVPAPNCVQVEVRALVDDCKVENRFFCDLGEAPSDPTMAAVAATVAAWISPTYQDMTNENLLFTEIVVRDMTTPSGLEVSFPVNVSGLVSTVPCTNETSFCISLRTGFAGRSRRGRMYLFPPSSGDLTPPNRVNSTYFTGSRNGVQSLIDALDAGGYPMVVVSYVSGGEPRITPLITRVLSAVAVDNVLDSMRSRKPGNGS